MLISRLTPTRHADVSEIAEAVIPPSELNPRFKGTFVTIWLEKNQYAQERHGEKLAVRVDCKGHKIGYLPELSSVTEWKGEHEWTKAVEMIRCQLFGEYDANGTDRWSGFVAACRYHDGNGYKDYEEFSALPPEEQKAWRLEQVSVSFPVENL